MDVLRALLGDRRLVADLAAVRPVVVAHEEPRFGWQRQNALDRTEQFSGAAAGEIGPRGAAVRHEQRVAHEGGVADQERHAGGRVPGRLQRGGFERADGEDVAVLDQPVELRAVALELGAFVEDLAKSLLHHADAGADRDLAAEPLLEIGRGREVVGVHMGFEQPDDLEVLRLDVADDAICGGVSDAAGRVVEVQDAVDDRAGGARRVLHHIGEGVGCGVEEGGDVGL